MLINREILIRSGSAIGASTMLLINPSVGTVLISSSALLTGTAILITNEYISKLKIRYSELREWIIVVTLLYEKTVKESMIVKKIDQKEAEQLKQIYHHYIDKRREIMNSTKFKVEAVFDDVINKDSISPERITKLNSFLAGMMWV